MILILIGGIYTGYVYGFNKGFDAGTHLMLNGPTAKLTEKPKPEVAPDLENMKRALTGDWQSVADKKLVRKYTESNEVTDSYANKKVSTGTFTLFSSATVKEGEVSFPVDKGRVYIAVTDSETSEGVSYFKIDLITPTDLKLTLMGDTESKSFNFKRI